MSFMRQTRDRLGALALASLLAACGSNNGSGTTTATGGHGGAGTGSSTTTTSGTGAGGAGGTAPTCVDGGSGTSINHVVIIIQENHTFDTYFGNWCTAPTGTAPTCTAGPSCCEAAPATDPTGASPVVLDDGENGSWDPNHDQACEVGEIDMGKMDEFVTGQSCSDADNFAYAPASLVQPYQTLAAQNAIADRYFQPIAGQSSSNDMYLAVAKEVFVDNAFEPMATGSQCSTVTPTMSFSGTTIADLLESAGKTVGWYSEGYAAMVAAGTGCPHPPAACGLPLPTYPCVFDPGDVPFLYYPQFATSKTFMRDYTQLAKDLAAGTLPDVSYVKAIGYHSEHPGIGTTISAGETFVTGVVQAIDASCYKDTTLVLLTWDEGGGFFDHIAPPPESTVDNQPYGTRVPLLAIGRYALKGAVSHTPMEHSSIVKFLEWNFLGGQTGQLMARDAVVNNIGSLLDPKETGVTVPDQ
jgi:phospholipase C